MYRQPQQSFLNSGIFFTSTSNKNFLQERAYAVAEYQPSKNVYFKILSDLTLLYEY